MTVIRSGMSFNGLVFAIILYAVAAAAATARDVTAARPPMNNKNVTRPPFKGTGAESHDTATTLSVGAYDKIYDIINYINIDTTTNNRKALVFYNNCCSFATQGAFNHDTIQ